MFEPPVQPFHSKRYHQPPGGSSSITFDDSSSLCEPLRRHTNGLVRRDMTNVEQASVQRISQPPGGSSTFALKDASSRPYHSKGTVVHDTTSHGSGAIPRENDSLSKFIDSQHTQVTAQRQIAPPGGRSSFSLGWGQDENVNHHTHYSHRARQSAPPPSVQQYTRAQAPYESVDQTSGLTRDSYRTTSLEWPGAQGCGVAPPRSSTLVLAPPGGKTSFTFG